MKALIAVSAAAFAVAAFAGPKGGPDRMPRPSHGGGDTLRDPVVQLVTNPRMAEKIGLTADQIKQIKAIEKENRNNRSSLRDQLGDAMEKQAELLKADKIDEAAVMAEIDKAFEARKAMAKLQTKRIIAIKAILKPEQVAKALEVVKNAPIHKRPKAGKDDPKEGCEEGCRKEGCKGDDRPPCPPPED